MPRYFFNTRIGDDLLEDEEGAELRDADHAWEVARATIRRILSEGQGDRSLFAARLEVTDASGDIVLEFPFAEAMLDIPARRTPRN